MATPTSGATPATKQANAAAAPGLLLQDQSAFEDAARGLIAAWDPPVVHDAEGRKVSDLQPYSFLDSDVPDTAHPSLWRMARLNVHCGLFRVVEGVYQVRGLDIANTTVIEGDAGYIVIDPLVSAECASAAMDLVREHIGDRPITAVIYTHSHIDHYGGVRGLLSEEDRKNVRIVAPEGFLQHVVSEGVYAGTAMGRRAAYMFGSLLEPGPRGTLTTGLGVAPSRGSIGLIPPTETISKTGQELVLDGVRFVFQYTPDTEAPCEMNFHLPGKRALCMAENVSHTMHNLYTLRGAEVRDPLSWSDYLQQATELFAESSDVLFISHHWPVWGQENIREFLGMQRDLYRYIHDETLRLANQGCTMDECAERVSLPESLRTYWSNRGYYGTLHHNVKAVYQKYLGWFDGNPAHLHRHEPVEAARRYVECMGGAEAVVRKARQYYERGDYRWVAEVLNHVVFAEPDNAQAREFQAEVLEQMGYQAESASWRNFYLAGAQELRTGQVVVPVSVVTPDVVAGMPTDMLLNYLSIRLNGPEAATRSYRIRFELTDLAETHCVELRNGVLEHRKDGPGENADAAVRTDHRTLASLALGNKAPETGRERGVDILHGQEVVDDLLSLCDHFDGVFDIVTR